MTTPDENLFSEIGKYVLENESVHDCFFILGEEKKRIGAVRLFLINQSRVWWSMLSDESCLAEKGDITIPDVEPEVFILLLKHCYGSLKDCSALSDDTMLMLCYCAEKYVMTSLKEKIVERLNPSSVKNLFPALHALTFFNLKGVEEATEKIVQSMTDQIFKHPEFLECDEESVVYITKQEILNCEEIDVWKAVVAWAKHQVNQSDEKGNISKASLPSKELPSAGLIGPRTAPHRKIRTARRILYTPLGYNHTLQTQKLSNGTTADHSHPKPSLNIKPQTIPVQNDAKETAKSILKNPASTTIPDSSTKPSPATKQVLFQTPKTLGVDFADLSKMNEKKTPHFGSESKSNGFEGAGRDIFGGIRVSNDTEGENAEKLVSSAGFKPGIPLPELVEVKTDEEGEEVLFNERAVLLKFESSTKEWKEEGIGQMKILKDPATMVTRLLMRQVYKVCYYKLIQSLELKPSPYSEKAWMWYTLNYSEGKTKNELYTIHFQTSQLAKEFKETVDKVQMQLSEGTFQQSYSNSVASLSSVWKCQFCLFPNSCDAQICKACSKFKSEAEISECKTCYTVNGINDCTCGRLKEKSKSPVSEDTAPPMPSVAEMFKQKAGSWECNGCLVRNDVDKTVCPACSRPKAGHEESVKEPSKFCLSASMDSLSFFDSIKPANVKNTGFSFEIKSGGDTTKSFLTSGTKTEANLKQQATDNFGAGKIFTGSNHKVDVKESPKHNFSFGKSSFSFCIKPADVNSTGFSFGRKSDDETTKTTSVTKTEAKVQETTQKQTSVLNLKQQSSKVEAEKTATDLSFSQASTSKTPSSFIWAPSVGFTSSFDNKPPGTMFSFANTVRDASCSNVPFHFSALTSLNHASAGSDEGSRLRKKLLRPLQHIRLLTLSSDDLRYHIFPLKILTIEEISQICMKNSLQNFCEIVKKRTLYKTKKTLAATVMTKPKHNSCNGCFEVAKTSASCIVTKHTSIILESITCKGHFYKDKFLFGEKYTRRGNIKLSQTTKPYAIRKLIPITIPFYVETNSFESFEIPTHIGGKGLMLEANSKYTIDIEFFYIGIPSWIKSNCELGHNFTHGVFFCSSSYNNGEGQSNCHIVKFKYTYVSDDDSIASVS